METTTLTTIATELVADYLALLTSPDNHHRGLQNVRSALAELEPRQRAQLGGAFAALMVEARKQSERTACDGTR
jgi:hypothetical protein